MQNVLILVAFVTVAYGLAHKVVGRLQKRFLVANGPEYILIGLMLGPAMPWPAAIEEATLISVAPVITLAIGWVGLIYGMQANLRDLIGLRSSAAQLALWEWMATATVVGGGTYALIVFALPALDGADAPFLALMLAASATVGSADVIALIRRRFLADGPLTSLLGASQRLGELMAIVTFGVLVCVYHQPIETGIGTIGPGGWLLTTLLLGGGLGIMFRLFIGDEHDADKQFLAILGIVVFASGAAFYLELSPLLVNLTLGVVLANMAPNADEILSTLERFHRPMVIMLLAFAGLLWNLSGPAAWILAGAYVVLRIAGKLIGGVGASVATQGAWSRGIGIGMVGHGEVAVAMAISVGLLFKDRMVGGESAAHVLMTAILMSVILNEIWSARFVRRQLIDVGEITADRDRLGFVEETEASMSGVHGGRT